MIRGQPTTIRIEGRLARIVKSQMTVTNVSAAFSLLAEAEILNEAHHSNGEGVIGHQDINLARCDACLLKGDRRSLGPGAEGNIAVVLAILRGFATAND